MLQGCLMALTLFCTMTDNGGIDLPQSDQKENIVSKLTVSHSKNGEELVYSKILHNIRMTAYKWLSQIKGLPQRRSIFVRASESSGHEGKLHFLHVGG